MATLQRGVMVTPPLLTEQQRTNVKTQACVQKDKKLICTSHYALLGKRLHTSEDNNPE